jgi:phytoene dehydrogenase-like protein
LIPENFEAGFDDLYRKRKFPSVPIVYLNETSGTDRASAPKGATNLFAVVTTPANEPGMDWESHTEAYRQTMVDTLEGFGITIDEDELDFERIQTPVYFEKAHGNFKGSLYGPDERHRLFKLLPLSNIDDRYRNLLYAGASVQPGAGLPMVILSGKFAAGKIR